MPLTSPPPIPQRGDPATFSDRVDAFLTWEGNTLVPQLNALEANLSSIAAGGAYAIPYRFTGSDVAGAFSTQSATQNTSTYLVLYNTLAGGISVLPLLQQFSASSSAVKGTIRVQKVGDTSKWLVFNVTSCPDSGVGYSLAYGAVVASSSASPFTEGDAVMVFFQRTGDKGDTGAYPTLQLPIVHVRHEVANGAGGGLAGTASTYIARQLNTVKKNTVPGASLSGGVLTLPAGTYRIRGFALSGQAVGHAARINTGGTFWTGSSACNASGTTGTNTASFVTAIDVSLGSATSVTLEHRLGQSLNSIDFGQPASAGTNEVYAELIAEKVA